LQILLKPAPGGPADTHEIRYLDTSSRLFLWINCTSDNRQTENLSHK
jgi:hypothetical protein